MYNEALISYSQIHPKKKNLQHGNSVCVKFEQRVIALKLHVLYYTPLYSHILLVKGLIAIFL